MSNACFVITGPEIGAFAAAYPDQKGFFMSSRSPKGPFDPPKTIVRPLVSEE